MSSQITMVRRGLPRRPGGTPWPDTLPVAYPLPGSVAQGRGAVPQAETAPLAPSHIGRIRRGLPRTVGGAAWPPEGYHSGNVGSERERTGQPLLEESATGVSSAPAREPGDRLLRRGLPRVTGADMWPPAGLAPGPAPQRALVGAQSTAAGSLVAQSASVSATASPVAAMSERAEPRRFGKYTAAQWVAVAVVAGAVLVAFLAGVVLFAQWLRGLPAVQGFLAEYPGGSELPEEAPVGVPPWMAWQHFFNLFLMVLIIRSGLQIRRETRAPAYWAPRGNPARKISLTAWFHQSLDLLWVVNGIIFVVMLFVTGQWVRIVPVSVDVVPNALSAGLQYASLHWPTENGWVHYNALQQITYFVTVFLAAPLAAVTGIRMSGVWPKNLALLSRIYPVEVARKIHFPVMLYFVIFIVVHVALVFATGALRNLNHMYAAQGSVDADAYAANWVGFWIFAASLLVIAAAVAGARPAVLAPIARLFGTVSSR